MATFDGTQYGQKATLSTAGTPLSRSVHRGAVRVYRADFPATVIAQNDLVNLFDVGPGVTTGEWRPLWVNVEHGAYGASVTLDVGWTGNTDAIVSALDIAAAGTSYLFSAETALVTGVQTIQALFEGADPADDQTLAVTLAVVEA